MSGRRCLKRLYLECYERHLMATPGPMQRMLFDMGRRVGELARECFPGAVLVTESFRQHARAVQTTCRLMRDPSVPALCEAAFEYQGVRVRVDVLRRASGGGSSPGPESGWDLIEVKGSARAKDDHKWDAALQLHVLEGCGVPIGSVKVMHINRDYVYEGGPVSPTDLFILADVTEVAREYLPRVEEQLETMRAVLGAPLAPVVAPGRTCFRPFECPFAAACVNGGPEHPLWELPGVHDELLCSLGEEGCDCIASLPEGGLPLNELQERVRRAVATGEVFVDGEALRPLLEVEYPVHFLDFEAFMPFLPRFVGTSPFQTIPFQFSCHVLDEEGHVAHAEYLHEEDSDPRRPLAERLLHVLGEKGTIVSYAGFEGRRIVRLAEDLPDLSAPLLRLPDRLLDLYQVVKEAVYHPGFHGSFSLKKVLPALLDGMGYDDLEVCGGGEAAFLYAKLLEGSMAAEERTSAWASLRSYCARDTEGLLQLFLFLRSRAEEAHCG